MKQNKSLKEVALLFLKLGAIGFGGPAAHIAMMEDEVVEKRQWMTRQHFLDLVGATNLIPGPNSTEMTMHSGHEAAGWKGLFVAGISFIFPAVVLTGILAFFYDKYGELPDAQSILYGVKAAVIAIILSAFFKLAKKAIKTTELGVLAVIVFVICLLGVNEILVIFGTAAFALIFALVQNQRNKLNSFMPFLTLQAVYSMKLPAVFWSFLKIGAILYGSGYVLFAFLDAELVSKGLLTRSELIDAVAIGQITPGPVLSTATFIGWQLHGLWGALAATIGIFLPSFLFVWLLNPLIPKMRQSKVLSLVLDAVNVAAVAVILSVTFDLAKEAIIDWRTILILGLSLLFVFGFKKVNSAFIVIGSGLLGYALSFIQF